MMALPFAFREAGWLGGLVGLVLVAILSGVTMRQLLICSQIVKDRLKKLGGPWDRPMGFREIAGFCFGHSGELVVDLTLVTCQIGANCAFISFISSNISSVLSEHESLSWITNVYVIWGVFPVLCALCLLRNTTYLAPTSHFGNVALLVGIGTVLYYSASHPVSVHGDGALASVSIEGLPLFNGWSGFATFLGIAAFSMCAHAEIQAINNDVESSKTYVRVLDLSMLVITLVYAVFAMLPYMSFKDETHSNIFLNLGKGTFVAIVKITMSLVVTCNYPLSMFPAMECLDAMLWGPSGSAEEKVSLVPKLPIGSSPRISAPSRASSSNEDSSSTSHYVKGSLLRIAGVAFTCVVASIFNDFGLLTALVGSLTGGLLCYILPTILYYKLVHRSASAFSRALLAIQMLASVLLFMSGLFVALRPASNE